MTTIKPYCIHRWKTLFILSFTDMASNLNETSNIQSQHTPLFVPPTLRQDECYHVFLSYSSIDYKWTHSLIDKLESMGLMVCYHERDFTPGRTVLENMSECIRQSQKVLLVLSPEFVRSRWCLLEANMSLFRDCLERKPIVPVLLDRSRRLHSPSPLSPDLPGGHTSRLHEHAPQSPVYLQPRVKRVHSGAVPASVPVQW